MAVRCSEKMSVTCKGRDDEVGGGATGAEGGGGKEGKGAGEKTDLRRRVKERLLGDDIGLTGGAI